MTLIFWSWRLSGWEDEGLFLEMAETILLGIVTSVGLVDGYALEPVLRYGEVGAGAILAGMGAICC